MMKKLLLGLFMFLGLFVFSAAGYAAPFLVCDPQEGVTEYELDIDGTVLTGIAAEADGSIKYSMDAWLNTGTHSLVGRCRNAWGWGEWNADPFVFSSDVPGSPTSYGFSD